MSSERPLTQFRVLIVGRANAGKTAILSSVCGVKLDVAQHRGEHDINAELKFPGYVFHDSRGVESGSAAELDMLVEFIQQRGQRHRLIDRLHAIWYCIPLVDNPRSCQDIEFYKELRERVASAKVPLIVAFTKYDAFKNQKKLEAARAGDKKVWDVSEEEVKSRSDAALSMQVRECECGDGYVALEEMHKFGDPIELLNQTAKALDDETLMFMLYSVQKDNVNVSIRVAIDKRQLRKAKHRDFEAEELVRYFPIPVVRWWLLPGVIFWL